MRVPSTRSHGRRILAFTAAGLAALALVLGFAAPRAAWAEEAWEAPIREGIADQDRELARTSPKAIINRLSGRLLRNQNDVTLLYLLARAYGKAKDAQNAIVTYGDVLKLEPRLWYAWRDRALLRYEGKDVAGAKADLRQAIALQPDFSTALQDLAAILSAAKENEEAAVHLNRVLDLEPKNEKARFQLVTAYIALKKPDDGLRVLQPMLAREPNHPGLRLIRARLWTAKGDFPEAFAEFKRLAIENPIAPEPLQGWLETAEKAKTFDPDEGIWILERLARLLPEERRKDVLAQIERIRKEQAKVREPQVPTGPPTPDQLAALIASPDEATRRDVLSRLLAREAEGFQFTGPVTAALVERALKPDKEPVPALRQMALAIFGKTRNPRLAPALRLALYDPDARVRAKAADVLGELGSPASIPALYDSAMGVDASGLVKEATDREAIAVAARAAVYQLAKSGPPGNDASLAAFRAWWADVNTRDVKHAAIDDVLRSEEKAPWYVLEPFLRDEDPTVWTRSYYAFKRVTAKATDSSPLHVWLREMPVHDATTLVPEKREAFLEGMRAWWAKKPK